MKYYLGDKLCGGEYESCGQHSEEERRVIDRKDYEEQEDTESAMEKENEPTSWPESD